MNSKTLAALALLPIGLFASSAQVKETAASQEIVSYGQSQDNSSGQGSSRQSRNSYDDKVQVRGQPMPQQDQRIGLKVGGDYLYWKPYFSNMPYAYRTDQSYDVVPSPGGVIIPANGRNLNMDMDGDSGFRVWAGFFTDWQDLAFDAVWTRFYTQTKQRATNNAMENSTTSQSGYNDALFAYWNTGRTYDQQGSDNAVVFDATGNMDMEYDLLDFIFSTKYEPRSWARVMPGVGIRALFTKMQFTTTQVVNRWGNQRTAIPFFNTATQRMTQNFNAVGLVSNVTAQFDLYESFKAITGFGASYVVGQMYETQFAKTVQQAINNASQNAATNALVKSNQTLIKPQFDAEIGLQYEWMTDEKNFGLLLDVAYEVHYLPNFFQMVRYNNFPTDGNEGRDRIANRVETEWSDLLYQGLRVRAGFSF